MMRKSQARAKDLGQIRCSQCGGRHDTGQGHHLHHDSPTDPADEIVAAFPPPAGPDDLLDVASQLKDLGVDTAEPDEEVSALRAGDLVQLCFKTTEPGYCSEAMWVLLIAIEGAYPEATYRGELWNLPLLIGPGELQIASPVTFEARHVHSVLRGVDYLISR
jgi:hypothetical protein